MNNVLEWAKANVFIVVFIVVMLAAIIGLPLFAGKMNAQVKKTVNERAANFTTLAQLEKGEVIPGFTGIPNQGTLQRYEQVARLTADDAAAVQRAAIEHNQKGRTVLLANLFPEPPATMIDVLPKRFHEALVEAYGNLLASINAGMPPDLESLRKELEFKRNQFITQDLRKSTEEKLSPEEEKKLTDQLSSHRLSLYVEAAKRVGMYLSTDQLNVPGWNQANQPSIGELFNWQWEYWIVNDVLRALHSANSDDRSVLTSPVKRINWISVRGLPSFSQSSQPATGAAVGGFGGGGVRGGPPPTDPAAPAAAENAAPALPPINTKAPAPKDYKQSITGRVSNPLYDVIYVDLEMVVETAKLPRVLNEISRYNFFTVSSLRLNAADAFTDVQSGFCYGVEPVSQVTMTIETIWLRTWTQQLMPKATLQALGIGGTVPGASAAPQPQGQDLDL